MIDISFEINGRKVNPRNAKNALESAALESVKRQLISKLGSIRDPKTGLPPKIKVKGNNLNNLSFEVSGSEEVIQLVEQKLKS